MKKSASVVDLVGMNQIEISEVVDRYVDCLGCVIFLTGKDIAVSNYVESRLIDSGKTYWIMKESIRLFEI